MSTSSEQVSRLLSMVPYVSAHPGVAIADVAEQFGITPKQVLADLKVLWMCGLPGGLPDDLIEIDMDAAEGEGVVHLSNADYLTRPLRFNRDEAFSLAVALQAIAGMATGTMRAAAESALAKLTSPTQPSGQVDLRVNTGDEAIRAQLVDAIDRGRRVQLVYDGATRGETTRPQVDPGGIQMRDSVVYLQGWSVPRQAWRTFRLDRIAAVEVLDEPADDHDPVPELPVGWFEGSDGEVLLELAPPAAWVTDYYPVRDLQRYDDGTLVARFAVADGRWLDALLLRLGENARVLEPVPARQGAANAAREALALTKQLWGSVPD